MYQTSDKKRRCWQMACLWLMALGVAGCGMPDPTPPDDFPNFPKCDGPCPEWLIDLVDQMEGQPPANPPAFIAKYEYQGMDVYYLPPSCCDVPSALFDEEGTVLCSPDGGLSGHGDGRCPDFFETRQNQRTVWQDSRS